MKSYAHIGKKSKVLPSFLGALYLIVDLDWYSSFFIWIAYISAYLPLLIIYANLIPLHKLKAAILKLSCCKKSHRFEVDETEGEESADDRDKLLQSSE